MYWIILILGLIGIDQWAKWFFLTNQQQFDKFEVIKDFFYLTYLENRGAAFGILQNFRWGFILLTVVALLVLIRVFWKNKNGVLRIALSFVIAGAVGNFIDRLFRGFVVDFLDFYPFGYDFAIFNAADVWINVGVFFLIIYVLFIYKEPAKEQKEDLLHSQEVPDSNDN